MKLQEAIKYILDDDWLEITTLSEGKQKYKRLIGRAPKKVITGEVLNYEVVSISNTEYRKDYTMHVFLVRDDCVL